MAFAGMFLLAIFIAIIAGLVIFTLLFLILAFIFKKKGKKKTGRVMLVLGVICAIPLVIVVGYFAYTRMYDKVTIPDGSEKLVLEKDVDRMWELIEENTDESVDLIAELLEKNSDLVYYRDANRRGLLDHGLIRGNYDMVKLAIQYGASFDDLEMYQYRSCAKCSMEEYLDNIYNRPLTENDVKLLRMLTEEASTDYILNNPLVYSNAFGQAVWVVLYNDETVTDIEIEFLEVLIDHGIDSDEYLLLYEEMGNNISYSDRVFSVVKDENYEKVMAMIGR